MMSSGIFRSFFLGGFECSTMRRGDRRRLDLLASTRHDLLALGDYRQLTEVGIGTMRDGVRWHRIEGVPGHYDWSSALPMLRAALDARVQVVWDLCHYGWPDDVDIWSPAFPDRFARFCRALARLVREESDEAPFYCPVNEISFWAWAGGEVGRIGPLAVGRGGELKQQLVRAAVAGARAVREVDPRARLVWAEPLVHVASGSQDPAGEAAAEAYRLAQFEGCDMISGRARPELGGGTDLLDIVGVNFYPDNQWYLGGATIPFGHHAFRPLRTMLAEVHARYGRPILIAETGAEGHARPYWLNYVCGEVGQAMGGGTPIAGICLYPVVDYPGWENDRNCQVGALSAPDRNGRRSWYEPLREELHRQQAAFAAPGRANRVGPREVREAADV